MPHQVVIAVYNSAGERVRLLYQGAAQYLPGAMDYSSSVIIGGEATLSIRFPGRLANNGGSNVLAWDGSNDNAGFVSGGFYVIKTEITDPFGQITALTHPIQVLPSGRLLFVRIFNNAGEIVRKINLVNPMLGAMDLRSDSGTFGQQIDPVSGETISGYKINVLGNNGMQSLFWNGLNDRGTPVSNGTYLMQLVSHETNKETIVSSRSVTVLKSPDATDASTSELVAPNPVLNLQPILVFYDPALLMGTEVYCQVYSLTGAWVGCGADPQRQGRIVLQTPSVLASGTYLVHFEIRQQGLVIKARILKLAVVR